MAPPFHLLVPRRSDFVVLPGFFLLVLLILPSAFGQPFEQHTVLTSVQHSLVSWADYDGDGDLDLFDTSTLYNNNDGTLEHSGYIFTDGTSGGWADFDNDGDVDLIVTGNTTQYYENSGGVLQLKDVGIDQLKTHFSHIAAPADFDNDGDIDLAVTGGTELVIFENDGGLFTVLQEEQRGISHGALDWADYDSDGDRDLLIYGYHVSHNRLLLENKGGSFELSGVNVPYTIGGNATWTDFDNDGAPDLAISSGESTRIHLNTGDSFNPVDVYEDAFNTGDIDVGDLNGDGLHDIVLSGRDTKVLVIIQSSYLEFDTPIELPVGLHDGSIQLVDFDGDGDLDISASGINEDGHGRTYVYENQSSTTTAPPTTPTWLNEIATGTSARLQWDQATDNTTPGSALMYNIRIGTAPGAYDVLSPALANGNSGSRLLSGEGTVGFGNHLDVSGLFPETTYYWSVQSIDTGYLYSSPSVERSFTTPYENLPPVVINQVADQVLDQNQDPLSLDMESVFEDPQGEILLFSGQGTPGGIVSIAVDGSTVTITPLTSGQTEISLVATDLADQTAEVTFTLDVIEAEQQVLYVDPVIGDDTYTGFRQTVQGSGLGPKATIEGAVLAA